MVSASACAVVVAVGVEAVLLLMILAKCLRNYGLTSRGTRQSGTDRVYPVSKIRAPLPLAARYYAQDSFSVLAYFSYAYR